MKKPDAEAMRAFEDYLRSRDLRVTGERRAVLDAFLGIERHVTTEELLLAARRLDPDIGQATVFRTIKLLEEAGLARSSVSLEGARRFEHAFRHEHHDHLICVECGTIVEFKDERIEGAQEAIYRAHGFAPTKHTLELRGLCPACRRGRGGKTKG